ncbi:hypothetical protein NC653_024849 [Populus alba x Populus x berolinensis]|uniref:Uncharacterized protein n=1 Tax=Populus alba x Populus x berolinensis TaxID=444605 RepID=A0AAD6Q979_9ROSI|nr:hypothetical protein NC653_024849 [Populus alba x Populus x berolinensis]
MKHDFVYSIFFNPLFQSDFHTKHPILFFNEFVKKQRKVVQARGGGIWNRTPRKHRSSTVFFHTSNFFKE